MKVQYYVVGLYNGKGDEVVIAQGDEFDLLGPIIEKIPDQWTKLRIVKGSILQIQRRSLAVY